MFQNLKEERAFWKRLRSFPNKIMGCRSGLEPIQIRVLTVFLDTEKEEIVFSIMCEDTLKTVIRSLPFRKVQLVEHYIEEQTVTTKKRPIARAVVGGMLAGGVGAVVGAVSGQGESKDTVYAEHMVFVYTSSDGKLKEIDLVENSLTRPGRNEFIEKVCSTLGLYGATVPKEGAREEIDDFGVL